MILNVFANFLQSPMEEYKALNFNQLIEVKNQQIAEQQKTRKEYRDAILFEEILRTEKIINLYDCRGRVFWYEVLKNAVIIIASSAILYHFWTDPDAKPKRRRFNVGVTIVFIITRFLTYRRYQKSFVDKVMYDTTTKLVTLTKRSLFTLPYE